MRPRDAKCFDEVATKLRRDNFSTPDFWISFDGHTAIICKQKIGHSPDASIEIPRKDFVKLADWFYRNQGER